MTGFELYMAIVGTGSGVAALRAMIQVGRVLERVDGHKERLDKQDAKIERIAEEIRVYVPAGAKLRG